MPMVRIELWDQNDADFKRKLARDVTKVVAENVKCPEQAVSVVITEVPKENWAIGGELATDYCQRLGIGKKK
ncbi:MAG: tautomerase family protein [bacterium]|nr:tautomerase family protein [bacterium]